MYGYWYFLPQMSEGDLVKADRLDSAALASYQLAQVLDDVHTVPDQCIVASVRNGPESLAGTLLYPLPNDGQTPKLVGYHPDAQTWRMTSSGYHLGYCTEIPPTPEALERRRLVPGYTAADRYDCDWIVPILRSEDNPRGRLATSYSWDADDQPVIGVDARYAALWERSAEIWDMIDKGTEIVGDSIIHAYSDEDQAVLFGFVRDCLAVNYRVDNPQLATLERITPGWLDEATLVRMAHAAVDLFKYRQFLRSQKKTGSPLPPDGVNSGPGTTAAAPSTAPAEAS